MNLTFLGPQVSSSRLISQDRLKETSKVCINKINRIWLFKLPDSHVLLIKKRTHKPDHGFLSTFRTQIRTKKSPSRSSSRTFPVWKQWILNGCSYPTRSRSSTILTPMWWSGTWLSLGIDWLLSQPNLFTLTNKYSRIWSSRRESELWCAVQAQDVVMVSRTSRFRPKTKQQCFLRSRWEKFLAAGYQPKRISMLCLDLTFW